MCSIFLILHMSSHFGMHCVYHECGVMEMPCFVTFLECVWFPSSQQAILFARLEVQSVFLWAAGLVLIQIICFSWAASFRPLHAWFLGRPETGEAGVGVLSRSPFSSLPGFLHSLSQPLPSLVFRILLTRKAVGFSTGALTTRCQNAKRTISIARQKATEMGNSHRSAPLLRAPPPQEPVCSVRSPGTEGSCFCVTSRFLLEGLLPSFPEAGSQFDLQDCFWQQRVGNNRSAH